MNILWCPRSSWQFSLFQIECVWLHRGGYNFGLRSSNCHCHGVFISFHTVMAVVVFLPTPHRVFQRWYFYYFSLWMDVVGFWFLKLSKYKPPQAACFFISFCERFFLLSLLSYYIIQLYLKINCKNYTSIHDLKNIKNKCCMNGSFKWSSIW